MCRIAGIFNPVLPNEDTKALVKKMCGVLQHGGPDDEGIYEVNNADLVLGHRRLAIIDLSANGHQPMLYKGSQFAITYNGELYNYAELKAELKILGCTFSTNSDTEVILAAYSVWGTAAFTKFLGMFALALWDEKEKTILLVRDPAGIKPLYYANTPEGLAFASEVKALKCIPYLQQRDKDWPVFFMAYGHLPEPVTTLQNVQPLGKGHFLKYSVVNNKIVIENYCHFGYIEKIDDRHEAINAIKSTLEKAVKRHLISDAPIGVFLSGGLDSSIIAQLATKFQAKLNTISIHFEDHEYSEKKYQDLLRQNLNCSHYQHLLKEDEFHQYIPDIIAAMDLPCSDGINTWFISKYAKESGVKAVLSGIGGDELFGGYPSFKRTGAVRWAKKLPDTILKIGGHAANRKIRRIAYLSIKGTTGRYLFLRGQFAPCDIANHLDANEEEIWRILSEKPLSNEIDYMTRKNQISWLETNMYMQNQLLRDADVMSMAHGLELRVPFLDTELIQLAMKISSELKYSGRYGKQLLIDAFKDILPEPVWNRPKMGFSFPFKEWFSHHHYSRAEYGARINKYHTMLTKGNQHWSQFFTLLLLQQHADA